MPILLDRKSIRSLFTMSEAIDAAREAFLALAADEVVMPQRLAVSVAAENGTQLSMPCFANGALAIKVATVFPDNMARFGLPTTLAFLALQDARSGALLALMDAEHLTSMRTAAASALATDLLANPDAEILATIGAGAQAEAHIEAIIAVRHIREAKIVSRQPDRAKALAARATERFGISARPVSNVGEALQGANIVCAATNSETPVFASADLPPGVHINAIGSFRPGMREFDVDMIRAAKVYVDRREAAKNGAGELIAAAESGEWRWDDITGELGELLTGRCAGRSSKDEITLFKSVGLSVQDACAAARVYKLAVDAGMGVHFDLA